MNNFFNILIFTAASFFFVLPINTGKPVREKYSGKFQSQVYNGDKTADSICKLKVNGLPIPVILYKDICYSNVVVKKFPVSIILQLQENIQENQFFSHDSVQGLIIRDGKVSFQLSSPGKFFIQAASLKLAISVEREQTFTDLPEPKLNLFSFNIDNTGHTIVTPKIQKLIDSLYCKGGGTIVFPKGKYLSGTLEIKTDVYLYLQQGALLQGTNKPEDYPVDKGFTEGDTNGENFTFSRLIYFNRSENCGIVGYGTIDGDGRNLRRNGRKSNLIRIKESRNIRIEGIVLRDPAAWNTHVLKSENVQIRNVKMFNDLQNANTDGIDPDASKYVTIEDFMLYCSDDCFAVKSTNNSNLLSNTSNIIIRNGICWTRKSALKIGTETKSDSIGPVLFENICIPHADRGIYLTSRDGAVIHNITFRNIVSGFIGGDNDKKLFLMTVKQRYGQGKIQDIRIENWNAHMWGEQKCSIEGLSQENKISRVSFSNLKVQNKLIDKPSETYWKINQFAETPVFLP